MPVSGNEEMGVKPSVGQFSEYSAGIPIKKRRYPFIWSPSQPAEDSSSLSTENESEQKGISSLPQGSTASNDSSIATSSKPGDVLASSNVLVSLNTSGLVASSSAGGINAVGVVASLSACSVPASLNAGSSAASSNASSVAMSSTAPSVVVSLNAGSIAASSYASGIATSSTAVSVAASLNDGSVEASSNVSSVATSSTAVSISASLNAGSIAASSNASGVAMSSTAIRVTAGSNASRALKNSNASSVAPSISSISDATEKSVPEKEKTSSDDKNGSMVQGNTNLITVKLEEQSFKNPSMSLVDIDSKGKLVATGESDDVLRKPAKSELDLGNDSLTLNIGEDISSRKIVDGKFRSPLATVSGNPGLSLGLSEYLSAVASGNNEQRFQNQEKTEPVSLDISLSKRECCTQLRSTDVQPNTNGTNMLADRTNWDLNTTMDSWEGPASDDGMSKQTIETDDVKRLICSAGMTANSMPAQQHIIHRIAKIEMSSSILSSQQYGTEDSLRLGLSTPYLHSNSNEKPSGSPANVDLGKVVANISSPGEPVPVSKPTMVNLKPVKSEPHDESVRSNSARVEGKPMGLLNVLQVKCELMEKCISESSKTSTLSTLNSVDARSLKPEAAFESNKETPERIEGSTSQSDEQIPCSLDTSTVPTSTDSSLYGSASSHVEHFIQAKETEPASKMISSVDHDVNESIVLGKVDYSTSQSRKVEDPDHCRLKFKDVQLPDSRGTAEGSASDEEKINLSGDVLEEDSYGLDDESDDNRELAAAMDIEHDGRAEDDFEDGEVREPIDNTEIEVPMYERQVAGNGNTGDTDYRNSDFVGFIGDNNPSSSPFKEKETQREDPGNASTDNTNACIDTSASKDSTTEADKEGCLQESSAIEMASSQIDKKAIPGKSRDVSGNKDTIKRKEGEQTTMRATDTSQRTSVTIAQGDDAKNTDSEGKSNSVLPKAEAFSNRDDAGKDVDNGDGRSRIINLSRASNLSSPGRTRPISGKTLQSQIERERLPDVALGGDRFHPRGRDEAYAGRSHRFSRDRHHVQPSRSNRISFMRGRGRISSRIDTLRVDQDSECNFASEFYNGPPEFRVVRHKYASAVSDADHNFSSYNNGQDGAYFGNGRGGRKMLSDDSSIFPHLPPRRRSPAGRDGPAGRGLQMVRRVPRNLSPSRGIGEDGTELVGLRHMRGFADDHTDPMFAGCQPSFEGLDGPFVRGDRDFTSVQRRGHPQTRSKSPTRPRTRSPGPWSSLRRRSPDGFGGPLELPHRRSPPMYRMERMRSPDRPCFAGEMVIRRQGSPPYFSRPSNDLRDLVPGRDHGHPRSGIANRSPSGRILLRNRRSDIVDPRERNDGEDYFGGPMPSGRFHELGTDGNADERRRYSDRRGPVRPFRPPYSGADSENFHLNAEGGPRCFRFCPEEDPELNERGNMREREFDRRIKSRPGNAPRRTRNIEERDGNLRPGGQIWHDDGFDDMSQVKRKRF